MGSRTGAAEAKETHEMMGGWTGPAEVKETHETMGSRTGAAEAKETHEMMGGWTGPARETQETKETREMKEGFLVQALVSKTYPHKPQVFPGAHERQGNQRSKRDD